MDKRGTGRVAPGVARVGGAVLSLGGFVVLATGLAAYTSYLDVAEAGSRSGLLPAVAGAAVLTVGLVLLDRGFGRGVRPLGPLVPAMQVLRVPATHPDAVRLVAQVQEVYVERYGEQDATPLDPDAFEPPHGAFYVGYVDEEAVVIGGWRLRDDVTVLGSDSVAEIKRMYVVPAAQRRGHARAMLHHLEEQLRAGGAEVVVLETGEAQPEAIGLYESSDYVPVEGFGHYRCQPESRYYGKRL